MFKSHLEMIGSYEPISKKARFFNTYLKSLKGSQDIMAKEKRSYSSSFESQSIYSDSKFACERVKSPGYHYNPVSKDTYGVTPRKINARDFTNTLFRFSLLEGIYVSCLMRTCRLTKPPSQTFTSIPTGIAGVQSEA
uniref:Myofilin n=1 Tax=Anopheles merus TaxID=30066 RepID=A0A182UZM1_ANOME